MKRALLLLLLTTPAQAGILDPWYLAYRVQGGTIVQYMGPYSTKIACEGSRFSIPFGAEYLGCYQ